jgi:hypothetical protein
VIDDRRHFGGLFIGILITVIGVIFLLDQLEIVHAEYLFEVFWPVVLIGLGMAMILRTSDFRAHHPPAPSQTPDDLSQLRGTTINFWGPVLILIGGLWLISNITHFDAGRLWPLWMIAVGVWLLINKDRPGRAQRRYWRRYGPPGNWPPATGGPGSAGPGTGPGAGPTAESGAGTGPNPTSADFVQSACPPPPPGAPSAGGFAAYPAAGQAGGASSAPGFGDDVFEHSIVFMAFKRRITTQHFRYAKLSAVFGGFNLDFSMADMDSTQSVIHIDAVFGGGEIRIPPSWRVSIDAHAFGGAFMDETYARPDATAPAKTLIIRGSTVFGGVVIKN